MKTSDNRIKLRDILHDSFTEKSFLKATLSKPVPECQWKRVTVATFRNHHDIEEVCFEYFTERQAQRKNVAYSDAYQILETLLSTSFRSMYLKTAAEEVSFEQTDRGTHRLRRKALCEAATSLPQHNREKRYHISPDCPFLFELGITSPTGTVRRDRYDKFRQIQKFIEIISLLIPKSALDSKNGLVAADFGSGKHYLTFALHEFLTSMSPHHKVLGIEQRSELVALGNEVARKLRSRHLEFISGTIDSTPLEKADLVVALHACDTATDDALAQAIKMGARYICVAPCCHKYMRKRFTPSDDLMSILRHGLLAERFAESLTDSLRVLTLESYGYQTKLFEFISPEHTAKNTMITAVKTNSPQRDSTQRIKELCRKFALKNYYLDQKLEGLPFLK